jgi:hypothetical protein
MLEQELMLLISKLDEARSEIKKELNSLRNEFLSLETKLIDVTLKKERLQEKLRRLRDR